MDSQYSEEKDLQMKRQPVIRSKCKMVLLLLVLLYDQGCTIIWHTTSPEIPARTTHHQKNDRLLAYRLTYRAPHLAEFVYKWAHSKLSKSIESSIERAGFQLTTEDGAGILLDVQVSETQPRGAGPEWVTGLTLGAIPTWVTEEGTDEFVLGLCVADQMLQRERYLVNTKTFNWILVLPVFWINVFTWNDKYSFLGKAIDALLAKETMTPIQADSQCLR